MASRICGGIGAGGPIRQALLLGGLRRVDARASSNTVLHPIMRLQANFDTETVASPRLAIVRLLACLREVLEILLHNFLPVAAGLVGRLTVPCASLSDELGSFVELDLPILADEGMRALSLWRDVVREVVVDLCSLCILIVLLFGASHAVRTDDAWPVAARLRSRSGAILVRLRVCSLAGGLPIL